MDQIIDSAFGKDGKVVLLGRKGIEDADFEYLLMNKEMKWVAELSLSTY